MRPHVGVPRISVMVRDGLPELPHVFQALPAYEHAVREMSAMLSDAGVRHALAGSLGASAYRQRPASVERIEFLVGKEAFKSHADGFVTLRVPVIEFDRIEVDQVPLREALRVVEEGLNDAPTSDGVPIAPLDTIVIMKLLAGRTQDLADIEGIVASGADRELLKAAVQRVAPARLETLQRLFENVDRAR